MYMNIDILHDILNEKYEVRRYGRGIQGQVSSLPAFYERGEQLNKGKVYIARTYDLPLSPNESCLFVCVGACPANIWNSWNGEVLYIADSGTDILSVFNVIQKTCEKIIDWECNMLTLLDKNADVEEIVRISIPVFENRITVTDYDLRILGRCAVDEVSGRIEVLTADTFELVPDEKSVLFQGLHQKSKKNKEPYIYTEDGIDQYCINLYLADEYVGTCALMEDFRPIRKSDYILFQKFAAYIRAALSAQSRAVSSRFVTLKTIFTELLQQLPVSQRDLDRSLAILKKQTNERNVEKSQWICVVIRSANKGKTLPESYLCASLERILPGCTSLAYEGMLVSFCMIDQATDIVSLLDSRLEPYLRDMNFLAGISFQFHDIYKVSSYFTQACCALDTGIEQAQDEVIFYFKDYVLTYMLQHSCGQFEPELIFHTGLTGLRDYNKGGVDYWDTLRRYLNNESNAASTAKEMFLHRSTLLPRLEKIKTFVDIDTPEQRLYLRMCIHLYDLIDSSQRAK